MSLFVRWSGTWPRPRPGRPGGPGPLPLPAPRPRWPLSRRVWGTV